MTTRTSWTGLGQLAELIATRRRLDAQIDAAAATAIAAGGSWADLGRAADMTPQGAMNRWGAARPKALGEMTR